MTETRKCEVCKKLTSHRVVILKSGKATTIKRECLKCGNTTETTTINK